MKKETKTETWKDGLIRIYKDVIKLGVVCIVLFLFVVLGSFMVQGAISDGIVAYVTMNNDSATQTDNTGNQNNFTVTGASYSSGGILGGCQNFTAGANNIASTTQNAANLMKSGEGTINFWLKLTSKDQYDNIYHSGSTSTGSSPYIEYIYDSPINNVMNFNFAQATNNYIVYALGLVNTWEMVTMTMNSTGSYLYINGSNVASNTTTASSINSDSFKYIKLGSQWGSSTRGMNGCFDEFGLWNRTLTPSEISTIFTLTKTGTGYPFIVTPTGLNITWINQTPTNITVLNVIGNPVNITYIINGTTKINNTPYLNYSLSNASVYVNGSLWNIYNTKLYYSTPNNLTYLFQLYDNDVYPATYNMNESLMENTPHNQWVTTSNNQEMKVNIKNISTTKNYNIFEAFVNVNTTGSVRVWYCNSTYSTGNPSTNNNCVQFGTISTTLFNHSHNHSRHNVLSMPMISGTLGGVNVTSDSYIIFDRAVSTMQIGYVNGSVRTNVTMTTTNSGLSWTNQNWTADMHIHQYDGTEVLNYSACYNITASIVECSSVYQQSLGQVNLNPSAPQVTINSASYYYNDTMLITYTNSTPSNLSLTITGYNITIYNNTDSYFLTINNSARSPQTFAVQGLPQSNEYVVRVTATDSSGQTATGVSGDFEVKNKVISPCNTTITMNSSGVPVFFDYLTNNGSLFNYLTAYKNVLVNDFLANTTGYTYVIGLNGSYLIMVNSSYAGYKTIEISSCTVNFCNNNYVQSLQPCVANLKLVTYTDTAGCGSQYAVPTDNGSYVACVTPPNTDKELWFIILLVVVWIISMVVTIAMMPLMGILSFLSGLGLMYYANLYFGNPFLGLIAIILSVVAVIIGLKLKT
jgi:hypothetical protein